MEIIYNTKLGDYKSHKIQQRDEKQIRVHLCSFVV